MNRPQPHSPTQPGPAGPAQADDDASFSWLVSSLELRCGLLVQPLRIDPLDADWREVFRPS